MSDRFKKFTHHAIMAYLWDCLRDIVGGMALGVGLQVPREVRIDSQRRLYGNDDIARKICDARDCSDWVS